MYVLIRRLLAVLTVLTAVHAPQMGLAQEATCGASSEGACRQFTNVNGFVDGETYLFQFSVELLPDVTDRTTYLVEFAGGFEEQLNVDLDETDGPRLGEVQLALTGSGIIENTPYHVAAVLFFRNDVLGAWATGSPESTSMNDLTSIAETMGLIPFEDDRDLAPLDLLPTIEDLPSNYEMSLEENNLEADEADMEVPETDVKDRDELEQDDSPSRCDDTGNALEPGQRLPVNDVSYKACSGDVEFLLRCGAGSLNAQDTDRSETRLGETRVACEITVYNDGTRGVSVRASQFMLIDEDGGEYEANERLSDDDADLALDRLSVSDGDRESGYLFFDIPDDIRPPLYLEASLADGDTLTFIVDELPYWE